MPQSLSSILVHLVFSTKNREPFITPQLNQSYIRTWRRYSGHLNRLRLPLTEHSDHVHILFSLGRVMKIADLVEKVKTEVV